jgi:colicin import membrane protein
LIQSAVDRAKTRTEAAQKASKGETLSAGSGEGEGAAALGAGGRGGPGIVKGLDFIIYQNRMLATIKENWAWVGQRSNLRVVVQFGIKENGDIVGLKIVQPSGDPSYDESVLRALKKSSPLPAPPENYRKDFADVELTFRPRDLGA